VAVKAGDYAIGIDIGATKVTGAVVDLRDCTISFRSTFPARDDRSSHDLYREITTLTGDLQRRSEQAGIAPCAVGIGVPEIVDPEGRITSNQTFPWRDHDLADNVETSLPVTVESDVRTAALAEATAGAARGANLFVYLSIGSGISSAIVADGKPIAGSHGAALVLTSGRVTEWGRNGERANKYVLEEVASGVGLTRSYEEITGTSVAGVPELLALASGGDRDAEYVIERGSFLLGQAIARLVDVVDPEMVVLGGGLGCADTPYHQQMLASFRHHVWLEAARETPFVRALFGADSGVVGAAICSRRNA
jgi:glucokinase